MGCFKKRTWCETESPYILLPQGFKRSLLLFFTWSFQTSSAVINIFPCSSLFHSLLKSSQWDTCSQSCCPVQILLCRYLLFRVSCLYITFQVLSCPVAPRALGYSKAIGRSKVYLLAAVTLYDGQQDSHYLFTDTKPWQTSGVILLNKRGKKLISLLRLGKQSWLYKVAACRSSGFGQNWCVDPCLHLAVSKLEWWRQHVAQLN